MSVDSIELWHRRARPAPGPQDFNVQLGCHFEEIVEMLDTIDFKTQTWALLRSELTMLSRALKTGKESAHILNRKAFLDALADQVVTSVGTGHCAKMRTSEAITRVNTSNWSKFIDDKPVFDENNKIKKGPYYKPVDLTGLYE